MFKRKSKLILLVGILFGAALVAKGVFAERNSKKTAVTQAKNQVTEAKDQAEIIALPYSELKMFTEIFGRIKRDYVEEVSDKKLLEDAIKGMLSGLDPHSAYLTTEQYKGLVEATTGQFGGLGIEVTMENGFVKVISPIDDTPAQRAGLQAGDLIVRLDKQPVKGMTLAEAVKIMRGEPGDPILLTIIREGMDLPLQVTIIREIIKVKSVKSKMLEKNYGYLRISSFKARTGENVIDAVAKLKKENGAPLKGVVLDLRSNPGGVLSAATEVSDAFLEEGLIVYTEGRIKNAQMEFSAVAGDIIDGAPIIVLINAGSASASEIVAGALQDHNRAIIMGEKSFGKGSVQTILPTSHSGTAVKLTTARYYTPSGRSIQAEGIEPDIILARVKLESLEELKFKPVKEVDLTDHLESTEKEDNKEKQKETVAPEKQTEKKEKEQAKSAGLDLRDYPLHQALTLLKGLSLLDRWADVGAYNAQPASGVQHSLN